MNRRPLNSAKNPDISASFEALKRAAKRARELAWRTHTALVISENGRVKLVYPTFEQISGAVNEPPTPYGDKP